MMIKALNLMFLKLNRWQGRRKVELSRDIIDPEIYNHGRQAQVTRYIMGRDMREHLMERINHLENIIEQVKVGPEQDRHMVQVWITARRAIQSKLDALLINEREPVVEYSNLLADLGHKIDVWKERLDGSDQTSPLYETFDRELKVFQRQWRELASKYNPAYE